MTGLGWVLSLGLALAGPAPTTDSEGKFAGAGVASPAPESVDRPDEAVVATSEDVATDVPADPGLVAAALRQLPTYPSLADVQRAALRQAGIDSTRSRRTLRRVRAAAAAPRISVQFDHRLDQGWVLDREAGTADSLRNDSGAQNLMRVDATWELDRLIFSPDELRVTRSALDIADWRQRVLIEVTQLYFERQRLLLQDRLEPAQDLDTAIDRTMRIQEVEGLLSGMTGLEFEASAH